MVSVKVMNKTVIIPIIVVNTRKMHIVFVI